MKHPKFPPKSDPIRVLAEDASLLLEALADGVHKATVDGRYLHWDELTHRTPPGSLNHEQWWAAIKLARAANRRAFPLADRNGEPFFLGNPDPLLQELSELDRDLSGRVRVPPSLASADTRDRFRLSAAIEEAITSSQLEGATTTGVVARRMIRSQRKPGNPDERMILNNFRAMESVRQLKEQPLSREIVLKLHRTITADTLEDSSATGQVRTTNDVRVYDEREAVVHIPPSASELDARMQTMCAFANKETPDFYVHPIVRAIVLHFWLAYDHPFADGNGRTARALFYWSMLNDGYWLSEYVSISHILRKAPAQYARSYLHTETDDNDLTYFVLHQLGVLRRGIDALHAYVHEKARSLGVVRERLRGQTPYNHRQLALLDHAMSHPLAEYSVVSHSMSHDVTKQTARVDLTQLVQAGFLTAAKVGKRIVYAPAPDLEQRLGGAGARIPR